MATSDDGHYTRFDESMLGDADFCDTGLLNRCLGNLDHLADQFAQPRIKWVLGVGKDPFTVDPDLTPGASGTIYFGTEGFLNELWRSAAFDLHVREDNTTYQCRIRLRVGSAHATETATFRIALVPWTRPAGAEVINEGSNAAQGPSYAGVAHAWYTVAELVYLDADMVNRATWVVSSADTVGGGEAGARWIRVQLVVAARVSAITATAQLSGVELSEYIVP